jgi:hypothetical protein
MKKVFAPHLNRHVVLGGCRPPDRHAPMLKLANYLDLAKLPAPPGSADYMAPAKSVLTNPEGNTDYGDCVLAEEAHWIAVATANAGQMYSYTPEQTLALYSAITGFNKNDPSTDRGTDPLAALNYLMHNPYADGTPLLGYVQVDATNKTEVQFAINAFGNVKIWAALPDAFVDPFPSSNGFLWSATTPNPENGHCVGSYAFNSPKIVGVNCDGLQFDTWGLIGTWGWDSLGALCVSGAGGGLVVRITQDWLVKSSGLTPSGFAWGDLLSDFKAIGGVIPDNIQMPSQGGFLGWLRNLLPWL